MITTAKRIKKYPLEIMRTDVKRPGLARGLLSSWVVLAFLAAGFSQAATSTVGAGASLASPMGNSYLTLGKAAEFHGDFLYQPDRVVPELSLRATFSYTPFSVRNVNSNNAGVSHFATFVGGEYRNTPNAGRFGLNPFFGLQIGADYEVLNFSGVSNNSQNSSLAFASRAVPGISIPLSSRMEIAIEMPITVILVKNTLVIWDGSFSLRFKL